MEASGINRAHEGAIGVLAHLLAKSSPSVGYNRRMQPLEFIQALRGSWAVRAAERVQA